jgi:hypothetical protein
MVALLKGGFLQPSPGSAELDARDFIPADIEQNVNWQHTAIQMKRTFNNVNDVSKKTIRPSYL